MKLYEITEEMLQLQDMLSDPQADPKLVSDTLASVQYDFENKAESYAKIIRNMEAEAKAYSEEAKRFTAKATTLNKSVLRLKNTLKSAMEVTGVKSIKGDILTVSVQKNSGLQPLVCVGEPDDYPEEFTIVKREANNEAIRKYLSAGNHLPFARLEERGTSLRIK